MKTIKVSKEMLERLKGHVSDANYCFLCDLHPGDKHYHHDVDCPLLVKCPHKKLNAETVDGETFYFCEECGNEP